MRQIKLNIVEVWKKGKHVSEHNVIGSDFCRKRNIVLDVYL